MNPRPTQTGKRASTRLEKAGSTNPSSARMGNPVKQDRTLTPLSSSTRLALTHAPSGYTQWTSIVSYFVPVGSNALRIGHTDGMFIDSCSLASCGRDFTE